MEDFNKITLLSAAILTSYGEFSYRRIALAEAVEIIKNAGTVESAVGHDSTAEILSELLDYKIEKNRIEYDQHTGNTALVFRLKSRPGEGEVLDREQVEKIGYEFGLLEKIK